MILGLKILHIKENEDERRNQPLEDGRCRLPTDDHAERGVDIDRCVMRVLKGREMEIERADPDRIEVLGGKPGDKERYIESDFRIRSGLCPNGHGLMTMGGWGQECPTCGFTCNTMPDTPNGADA